MRETKTVKISLSVFLLILLTLIIIVMACYIYIEKTKYNDKIISLEEKYENMQNTLDDLQMKLNILSNNIVEQNLKNPDDEIQEDTIKVLVEMHERYSGMPGPDGATEWGTSTFIASDGWVYEYDYDEYDEKTTYPQNENLEELSKELLTRAKRTEKFLTDEELNLVKDYIKNIEEGKEEIKETKNLNEAEPQSADFMEYEDFTMYNYILDEQIPISPEIKGETYYESPSITKLFDIVNKYI